MGHGEAPRRHPRAKGRIVLYGAPIGDEAKAGAILKTHESACYRVWQSNRFNLKFKATMLHKGSASLQIIEPSGYMKLSMKVLRF